MLTRGLSETCTRFELTISAFLPLYVLGSAYLLPDVLVGSGKAGGMGVISAISAWVLICMTVVSVILLLAFRGNFCVRSNWSGGKVVRSEPQNGTALSFYSAILIPLVALCQFSGIGGMLCFWASILISFALVYVGCAYMSNPVLALFGLKTYHIECEEEDGGRGRSVVAMTVLTRRALSEGDVASGRRIGDGSYLAFGGGKMKMEQSELGAAKTYLREIAEMVRQHLEDSVSMFAVLESQSEEESFALKCIEVMRNDDTLEFDRHLFEGALEAYINEESAYADIREALEDKNKVAVARIDFFAGDGEAGAGEKVSEFCDRAMRLSRSNASCEVFAVDDIDRVLGVVFRYAVGKDVIYAYQKVPHMWVAKRSGMLIPRKRGFELYTKESLKFGAHFDF